MRIAKVSIEGRTAWLELVEPGSDLESGAPSAAGRMLRAVFDGGEQSPRIEAGRPGCQLPKIKDGNAGVREVLKLVMKNYSYKDDDEFKPQFSEEVLSNKNWSACIGGLTRAYGMRAPVRREQARIAAKAKHRAPVPPPPLSVEGPNGQRLVISVEVVQAREWVVDVKFLDNQSRLTGVPSTNWPQVCYEAAVVVAGVGWGMPTGWCLEVLAKWQGEWASLQTISKRKKRKELLL